MILKAIEPKKKYTFAKTMQELKEGDFIDNESEKEQVKKKEHFVNSQT